MLSLKIYPTLFRKLKQDADAQGISVQTIIMRLVCQAYPDNKQ